MDYTYYGNDTIVLDGKLTRITKGMRLDEMNHTVECHHTKLLEMEYNGYLDGIDLINIFEYLKTFSDWVE